MQRIIVIFLSLLYFAVSSGFTVQVHYCMGRQVSTSVIPETGDEHNCMHCGMKKKKGGNGCCNDEQKIVKSTVDEAMAKQIQLATPLFILLPGNLIYATAVTPALLADAGCQFQANAPPDPPACPVYLSIRNLRI